MSFYSARPAYSTTLSSAASVASVAHTPVARTPRSVTPAPMMAPPAVASLNVKRVTLTSKKNWWMVEMEEEEEEQAHLPAMTKSSFPSTEETAVLHDVHHPHPHPHPHPHLHSHPHQTTSQPYADVDPGSRSPTPSPESSSHVYHIPDRHPSVIFSFPTPTAYSAPPNATMNITPFATGSTSELFKCIVKKPEVVQLEINGELQTNATDVTTQFLAELRVYTTVSRHRNIAAFLGCLEGIGMVLEYIDGRTLLDIVRSRPPLSPARKVDIHNQILEGLAHVHAYGLSHGDLSLMNIYVTRTDTVKIIDFGRSVSAESLLASPDAAPTDPFAGLSLHSYHHHQQQQQQQQHHPGRGSSGAHKWSGGGGGGLDGLTKRRKVEQIHRGTRPFTAPEILRGECVDARLADAYSVGVVLACVDLGVLLDCDPAVQMRDEVPAHFFGSSGGEGGEKDEVFRERIWAYVQPAERRRRVAKEDCIAVKRWWDED